MKPVALFVLPKCSHCDSAKAYFKSKKIRYNLIDVTKNKQALKDCQKHGCKGAPVILIGNTWICGFDKQKINKELGIK
ncbi:glutaredoxin family protein [Halarcobacter bivalviorum]|uniref:Glutaredoxin, NrdH/YruB family n=1 Tax=Halarcobacter bivalviorum TaxID=663364 RepID=A0AAX2A577_9BACT|nr:glutaredoxin domain-containing protein [Halarcobacter bivalviorum]AXH11458.1 glutaredoxin, NrdH/YruB family [Halarcobacter bivalviorum]RXK05329.1 NrdH-redoxin [Halarcobacter bivalviorum]RXK09357.1 NrdH-redoxin [Halarcobacter bivalviorum]